MQNHFDPVQDACGRIDFAKALYLKDLGAMPDDLLSKTWGPKARKGYDVTFELVGMYRSFAELLLSKKGAINGPEGWVRAPEEFLRKEEAIHAFESAIDGFVSAFRAYGGDINADEYPTPAGPFTPLGMANLAVWHTMYHSGQLNYIQTLAGDDSFHWFS